MSDKEDEEVVMAMNRKSRFSRYRMRVRERMDRDVQEAMITDDHHMASYAPFYIHSLIYV